MTEGEESALINWATVTTNVTAFLIGTAVLGAFGGGVFMVIKLPPMLDQILKNQNAILQKQESAKQDYAKVNRRLEIIETSDKNQYQLIFRLLGK